MRYVYLNMNKRETNPEVEKPLQEGGHQIQVKRGAAYTELGREP